MKEIFRLTLPSSAPGSLTVLVLIAVEGCATLTPVVQTVVVPQTVVVIVTPPEQPPTELLAPEATMTNAPASPSPTTANATATATATTPPRVRLNAIPPARLARLARGVNLGRWFEEKTKGPFSRAWQVQRKVR